MGKEEKQMASTKTKRVYGVQDIAKIFAVSPNAASDFLEEAIANQLFPVIKVGTQYVVPADAFDEWNVITRPRKPAGSADATFRGTRGNDSVYTPSEIQKILAFSKSKTYCFLAKVYTEGKPFQVIKCGKNYRVGKESFDQWFCRGGSIQY